MPKKKKNKKIKKIKKLKKQKTKANVKAIEKKSTTPGSDEKPEI